MRLSSILAVLPLAALLLCALPAADANHCSYSVTVDTVVYDPVFPFDSTLVTPGSMFGSFDMTAPWGGSPYLHALTVFCGEEGGTIRGWIGPHFYGLLGEVPDGSVSVWRVIDGERLDCGATSPRVGLVPLVGSVSASATVTGGQFHVVFGPHNGWGNTGRYDGGFRLTGSCRACTGDGTAPGSCGAADWTAVQSQPSGFIRLYVITG
jgi:hypothetical protein